MRSNPKRLSSSHRRCQRTVLLCDADNIEKRGKGRRLRLDYTKLLAQTDGRELVRAKIYRPDSGFPSSDEDEYMRAGFEVKRTYKNSDAWFIADAFSFASKFDVVIFVGGDLDLAAVIPMLHAMGVRVEVWAWEASTSKRLKQMADEFVALTSDLIVPPPARPDRRRN